MKTAEIPRGTRHDNVAGPQKGPDHLNGILTVTGHDRLDAQCLQRLGHLVTIEPLAGRQTIGPKGTGDQGDIDAGKGLDVGILEGPAGSRQ